MAPRHLLALALLPCAVAAECACYLPTPCKGSTGCLMPRMGNSSQCPEESEDCRLASPRTLCEHGASARDGWCCWTVCSSLAERRTCGEAPEGFLFDKEDERDDQYCHDPLNVQERCCLREMRTMRAVEPESRECPRNGSAVVAIFERLDGSRASAPNQVLSGAEVMKNREWLREQGYLFLAMNFSAVDADGSRGISWYELELFCGLVEPRLETDYTKLDASDVKMMFANPILLAGLWSGIFVGEAFGIAMLVLKHAFGGAAKECRRGVLRRLEREEKEEKEEDQWDGFMTKGAYFTFAVAWPVANVLWQVQYAFFRIDWSVCDAPEGALDVGDFHIDPVSGIKAKFMAFSCFNFFTVMGKVVQWIQRRCPFSPYLDIDRAILKAQASRRRRFWFWISRAIASLLISVVGIAYAVFYGRAVHDFYTNPALEKCKRDEPNLALLYKVNSCFCIGRCVQLFMVSSYANFACPKEHTTGNPKSKGGKQDPEGRNLLDKTKDLDELKEDWEWFA